MPTGQRPALIHFGEGHTPGPTLLREHSLGITALRICENYWYTSITFNTVHYKEQAYCKHEFSRAGFIPYFRYFNTTPAAVGQTLDLLNNTRESYPVVGMQAEQPKGPAFHPNYRTWL